MNNEENNNNLNGSEPLQEVTVETSVPEEPYPITDVDAMMNEAAAMDIAPASTPSPSVEAPSVEAPKPVEEVPAVNPPVEPSPVIAPSTEPMPTSAPTGFEDVNKKSKVGIIIAIVVVLLLGVGGYFASNTLSAKSPLENAVSSAFKLMRSQRVDKPFKVTTTVKVNSKAEGYEFLSNYSIDYSATMDTSSNTSSFVANINEKGVSILDVLGFIKDNKAYIQSKKLTDKTYFVDGIDFSEMTNMDDIYYLMDSFENVIISAFKDEKETKKDATLSVGGNSIKVTENVYAVNKDNINRVTKDAINAFLSDEKAINILAKMTDTEASDIKKTLEEERDTDYSASYSGESRVSIYTKGFLKSFAGFALGQDATDYLKYVVDGDNESLVILMDENNKLTVEGTKDTADIKLVIGGEAVATGKITSKSDKEKTIVIDVPEFCTVTIDIKMEENAKVDTIDTSKAVDYKNITEEEMESIEKKLSEILEKTEAYSTLQSLMGTDENYGGVTYEEYGRGGSYYPNDYNVEG